MRSDLLLVCIGGPLLAVLLLKGRARRVMAAVACGMLAAFLCGAISGFFATLVQYDTLAAVLYISPLVEEGMKLALFLMFLFVCQLRDEEVPEIAVGIGVGFSLMESVALLFTAGEALLLLLFAKAFCSAMIHVACALMLTLSVNMIRRMRMETVSGYLGVYAVTVTVHALYNLLVSCDGVSRILGYGLPAALIAVWKLGSMRKKEGRGELHADE